MAVARSPCTVRIPAGERHLEDQIPIIGNGHEPVQSRPANDGIECKVHFGNIELYVLYEEVFLGPECDRQEDGPPRVNGM
jgi:hypothetical protein